MSSQTPYSRERLSVVTLLIMAAAGIALSVLVLGPFIPGLIWALAFAIVAWPLHRAIRARMGRDNLAAAASVLIVMLLLILPAIFVGWQIGAQVTTGLEQIQTTVASEPWKAALQENPRLARLWQQIAAHVDVEREARQFAESFRRLAQAWTRSAVWATAQILVALFALFYLLRDRENALTFVRSLMPLSERETDYFFEQIRAMTHATVYGTVIVAAVQGALGGLMFLWLGIPGALVWAVAMGVLAIVPTAGAFVVWMPIAVVLALQGDWMRAGVLAVWGTVVVGLIDNLLYPVLVGKEMRLHTLPVFLAIVGGLVMFGAVGIVLGPVVLAATVAILDILRARTAHARSAEEPATGKLGN